MFCSALRRRREWAPILSALSRSDAGWRETKLESHDIAFHIRPNNVFRAMLISATEVGTEQTRAKIERLHLLNGGIHIAIILLLSGEDAITALTNLQMEALHYGDVPIIPISSATDLPSCLTSLRKQCNELPSVNPSTSKQALVPYCANGQPLSERQANILTDIANGFRDLATNAFVPQSQRLICDFLGDRDGARVVSFFTGGPRPSTC